MLRVGDGEGRRDCGVEDGEEGGEGRGEDVVF